MCKETLPTLASAPPICLACLSNTCIPSLCNCTFPRFSLPATSLILVLGLAGCSSKTESTEGMSGTIAAASRFQAQQVGVADMKVDEKAQQVQDACAAAAAVGGSAKMASCNSGADKDVDSALNGGGNKGSSKHSRAQLP